MGPYSEQRQLERAQTLERILSQDLTDEARQMWTRHLRNLSRSEAQYNYRVRELYTQVKYHRTRGWLK